jgi:hypothetical protein
MWLNPRDLRRRTVARWVTLTVDAPPRGRWATGASLRGSQLSLTTRRVRRLARTTRYDYGRWRFPVRGVTHLGSPFAAALYGEIQLVRLRYVLPSKSPSLPDDSHGRHCHGPTPPPGGTPTLLAHPPRSFGYSPHPGGPWPRPGVVPSWGNLGGYSGGVVVYLAHPARVRPRPAGRLLRLNGVGFKGFRRGVWAVFGVGYSHYVAIYVANLLLRPRRSIVAVVATLAEPVCRLRPPDPYKGRGIHPDDDRPTLKEGKRR